MNWPAFSYLTPYFLSVIISVGVGIYAWRHRRVAGAIPLTWLALSEAAWTGGYIFELTSPGLEAKIFWDNIQFGGVFVPPLAFLAFALQYTGRQQAHPKRIFGLLAAPFFLAGLLIVTDKLHGLIRPTTWLIPGEPFAELTYDFTPTFLIIALYSYGLILSSLFILIAKFIQPHLLYRLQVGVLILGILVPLGGTILTMAGVTVTAHRDTTPLTFAIGNLIIAWGLFRYRLLDLAPVARDMLTENMGDAMFVLDTHSRVVDLNPAAQALVGQPGFTLIGQPAGRVFSNWPDLVEALSSETQTRLKLARGEGENRRYFDSIVSLLRDRRSRSLGHLLVMRDVTESTRIELELQQHRDHLEELVKERTTELTEANELLNQEIVERRQTEQILDRTKERYRTLFEEAPTMYIITTNQPDAPIIADCNGLFLNTLGYERHEVIGRPLADFYSPESRRAMLNGGGYQRALAGHFMQEERQLVTRDGCIIETLLHARPEVGSEEAGAGTWAMFVDITALKQAEAALRQLNQDLDRRVAERTSELARSNNQLRAEITERELIEETLRESEAFNRAVLNSLVAHVAVLDREGTITAINETWLRFARENGDEGITLKTGLGTNYLDVCRRTTGQDAGQAREALAGIEAVLAGSQPHFTLEYPCHSPDEKRWFLMQATPLSTKQGGVVVSHLNITRRKQAEEALWKSEEKYRLLVDNLQEGIWQIDSDACTTFVNPRMAEILGYTVEEMQGRPLFDFMDEQGVALAQYNLERRRQGIKERHDFEFIKKDGRRIYASLETFPFADGQGNYTGAIAAVADITERRQAEKALRASEERYRAVVEDQTEVISRLAADGAFLFVNDVYCRFFGKTREELIGQKWQPAVVPEDVPGVEAKLSALSPTQPVLVGENRVYAGDGQIHWMQFVNRSFFNQAGQLIEIQSVGRDITQRKQAEEALRRAHDELETRVIQRTAELRQANEALRQSEARNLARYHEAEALRQAALALTSTTDLSLLLHRILTELQRVVPYDSASIQLLKGDTLEIIAAHGFDNMLAVVGACFPALGEANPNAQVIASREPVILDDTRSGPFRLNPELYGVPAIRSWLGVALVINERPIGVITLDKHETNFYTQAHAQTALAYAAQAAIVLENVRLYQDLQTQMQIQQATQAQLVQSERMAALGRLMASIAHEINNPLQAVQGVLGLLGEELEGSRRQEKIDKYLYVANGEIERIAGIVHRMRDFYRPTNPQHREISDFYRRLPSPTASTVELPSILESVFLLINKQLQHVKITVEQVLDPALPPLPINPDHLKQVFLNLTLNAIDAMAAQGGTLRVCARQDKVRLTGSRPQRVVRIEFSDTGTGMPPDVLARLFEPLFSTKEHGSGFGLFTSYQIIQAYEGQISAASEEGRGTTFTILLPIKARLCNPLT